MVGGEDRQFGDAARLVEADIDRELVAGLFAGADESGMADLARQLDLEPIGGIMPRDIGIELPVRPFGEGRAEFGLRAAMRLPRSTSEKPPVSTGSVS